MPSVGPLWRTALRYCEEDNFKAAAAQLLKEIETGEAAAAAAAVLVIAGNQQPRERRASRNLVIDGVGFSNWDVEEGLRLAELVDCGGELSPRDSGLCVKLARTYTEQCVRTVFSLGDKAMRRLFAGKDVETGRKVTCFPTPPPSEDDRSEDSSGGGSEEMASFIDDDDEEASESGQEEEGGAEGGRSRKPTLPRGTDAATVERQIATPKKATPKKARTKRTRRQAPKKRRKTRRRLGYGEDSFVEDDGEEDGSDSEYVATDDEDDGGEPAGAAVATRGAARRGVELTAEEATAQAVLCAEVVLLQRMHANALRLANEAEAEASRRRSAASRLAKELEAKRMMLDSAQRSSGARGGQKR
jgi:hypothetical protein